LLDRWRLRIAVVAFLAFVDKAVELLDIVSRAKARPGWTCISKPG